MKTLLIVLGGLALLGAMIYGAWALEESSKTIKTVVIEQPGNHLFVVQMDEGEGETVLIECNEDRFEEAFGHFAKFLGVKSTPLNVIGGPMIVAHLPAEAPEKLKPVKRVAVEFLKRHSPRRIILLAHSECLAYDTIAAWENRLDEVQNRQLADVRRSVAVLRSWFPKSEIQVYYAKKQGNTVAFDQVPVDEKELEPIPIEILEPVITGKETNR